MKNKNISMRQMMSIVFIGLLALGAEVAPGSGNAGAAAWLGPILALIPLILLLILAFCKKGDAPRQDLGQALCQTLPKGVGRGLCALFLLWGLFLLVINAARCARRLTVAEGTPEFFSMVVLALAVWVAARSLPAFARSCEIFYLAMCVGVVTVVVLAAMQLRPEYVILFEKSELSQLPRTTLSVLGVSSVGLYALFLAGDVTKRPGDRGQVLRWSSLLLLTLAVLMLAILGSFGAPLVTVMERPFLQMVAGLGLDGAFQRLESLISALWMLGDIALLGLLLFAVKRLAAVVLARKESMWWAIGAGAVAFLGGEALAGQEGLLLFCQQRLLPAGSLLVGLLLLSCFFAVQWRRGTQNIGGQKYVEKDVDNPSENSPKSY